MRARGFSASGAIWIVATLSIALILTNVAFAADKEPDKFKIGVVLTLSGQMANMGTMYQDGLKLALEDINGKGGVQVGGKKRPIELIYYDDEATPKKALDAAQALVSKDNVKLILGIRMNEAVEAVQGFTEKKKVIVFIDIASYPGVYLGKKYGFLFSDSGWTEAMSAVRLLTEKPEVLAKAGISADVDPRYDFRNKKVAYLGREEMYCLYGDKALKAGLDQFGKTKGVKYVGSVMYPIGTTDVSPYMQRLMAMKPDIVYHALYIYDETYNCLRTLREMGYDFGPKGKLLTVNANDDYNWRFVMDPLWKEGVDLTANLSGGVDMPEELLPQYPMRQKFVERCMKNFNRPPTLFEDCAYDSLMIIAKAAEAANSITDSDKIREAILKVKYDGVRGPGQVFITPQTVPDLGVYQEQIVQPQYWRIVQNKNNVKYTGLKYYTEMYWGDAIKGEKLLH